MIVRHFPDEDRVVLADGNDGPLCFLRFEQQKVFFVNENYFWKIVGKSFHF